MSYDDEINNLLEDVLYSYENFMLDEFAKSDDARVTNVYFFIINISLFPHQSSWYTNVIFYCRHPCSMQLNYLKHIAGMLVKNPGGVHIKIIQATLNGVIVNSYYKPSNQPFDFQSSIFDNTYK